MEELNELFVAENKLNLAVTDIKSLPSISITKVTSNTQTLSFALSMDTWDNKNLLLGLCANVTDVPGN